jgi:Tfp pilus assembly protein PilN
MTRIDLLSADMLPAWRRHSGWTGVVLVASLLAGSFAAGHVAHARREQAIIDDLQRFGKREMQLLARRDTALEECRAADRLAPALEQVRSASAATLALVKTVQLIAGALPEDVWLDEIAIKGSQVHLAGATDSRDSVTTFVGRIAGDDGPGEITLKVDDAGQGVSFVVTAAQ